MKTIPNRLQCSYCIRNYTHGGECSGKKVAYDEKGCMVFKADERGCIRNRDLNIKIPLYYDFPFLNTWTDEWTLNDVDTNIRILKIYGFKWDTKTGELIVSCNIDYFVNEYHEDYKEPKQKPNLKIIK